MVNENSIKTTVEELKRVLDIKNFVGEPIDTGDKILIPFMKCGFGFGVGQGNGINGEEGLGSVAGAGIEPISIVVVSKKSEGLEGIRVLNLAEGNETNKIISELGLVVTDLIKEIVSNLDLNPNKDKYETKDESNKTSNVNDVE